jgi:hypothetical protein
VVAVSLAVTLTGWGLLAQAEARQGAQAAPTPDATAPTTGTALPLVRDLQELWSFLTHGMGAPAGVAPPVDTR